MKSRRSLDEKFPGSERSLNGRETPGAETRRESHTRACPSRLAFPSHLPIFPSPPHPPLTRRSKCPSTATRWPLPSIPIPKLTTSRLPLPLLRQRTVNWPLLEDVLALAALPEAAEAQPIAVPPRPDVLPMLLLYVLSSQSELNIQKLSRRSRRPIRPTYWAFLA